MIRSKLSLAVPALLAFACLVPALVWNVDWAGAGVPTKIGAVACIAVAAALWFAALRQKSALAGLACAALALAFTVHNTSSAFGNLYRVSADLRDSRGTVAGIVAGRTERLSQLSRQRDETLKLAGEKPAAVLADEMNTLLVENSARWRATNGCAPDRITLPESRAFCAQVGRLRTVAAAARQRDAIDAETAALRQQASTGPTVTEADTFAAGVASVLVAAGWSLPSNTKGGLPSLRALAMAVIFELGAALGPAFMFGMASNADRNRRPLVVKVLRLMRLVLRSRPALKTATPAAGLYAPMMQDDEEAIAPLARFLTERVQIASRESVTVGEAWDAYLSFCGLSKLEPGSRTAFGLAMGKRFDKTGSKNNLRYVGLRLLPNSSRVVALGQGRVRGRSSLSEAISA